MSSGWPVLGYGQWQQTCDTLHAHTQVLGKLAARFAPAEPQLQHTALRLTARGWETPPLPAPDGSGALAVALDLRAHAAVADHSDGRSERIPLTPDRPVAIVTRDVLAAFRAPYRGRSTPVNAWWGSFDLAVNLFSGVPADPPADDFISRNAMDAQEVAVGWWPGDARYGKAAFYAYAHPAPPGFDSLPLSPSAARWEAGLGEYVLDWEDVVASADPHATALEFARSAFQHACVACGWDMGLAASAQGTPPPVR